jgi:hypothetical protein
VYSNTGSPCPTSPQIAAPRLAEQQGRLRIDVDEDLFDGCAVWRVGPRDFGDAVVERLQAFGQAGLAIAADRARRDVGELVAVLFEHAKASGSQTGVDAENTHEARAGEMGVV